MKCLKWIMFNWRNLLFNPVAGHQKKDFTEDGATVESTGYVAINDTPEESYESVFAEAANRFSNLHG